MARMSPLNNLPASMSEDSFLSSGETSSFRALVRHFTDNDYKFVPDPEARSVQFFINGAAALYDCRVQLTHNEELIQCRVFLPVSARERNMRPLVAETLDRANHGMPLGGFHIDMDSGEICFHFGHVIGERELDDETISGVLSVGLYTSDRYFPAVMRVMFGGCTPADAVYLSELDVHAECIGDEIPAQAPAPMPPKPTAKKRRTPRKDPRLKFTRELPGLFGEKRGDENTDPERS